VAENAVRLEPVSSIKFPDNWENTGNLHVLTVENDFQALNRRADPKTCGKIPYPTKLGISLEEQGNKMMEQGNWGVANCE
jgi:hypothetical protein